jgi:hypothetical protein
MQWLWSWGGECFGYRDGENLWTADGKHVGRFHGDEVFASDGRYLGEIKGSNGNRLITNSAKRLHSRAGFTPGASRVGYVPYANYVGNVMYAGYEDFPSPDELP